MDIKDILHNAQNKKKVSLSVTISSGLKAKLDEIAKENEVSLSMLVEALLEDSIEKSKK